MFELALQFIFSTAKHAWYSVYFLRSCNASHWATQLFATATLVASSTCVSMCHVKGMWQQWLPFAQHMSCAN